MADTTARKIVDPKITQKRQQSFEDQLKAIRRASERRKELWAGINSYVRSQGCWVVSQPGLRDMRIQIPKNSALPTKLVELGYSPRACGVGLRAEGGKFLPVDIIEIILPGIEQWR